MVDMMTELELFAADLLVIADLSDRSEDNPKVLANRDMECYVQVSTKIVPQSVNAAIPPSSDRSTCPPAELRTPSNHPVNPHLPG